MTGGRKERPDTLGKSAQRIVQTDKEAAADLP